MVFNVRVIAKDLSMIGGLIKYDVRIISDDPWYVLEAVREEYRKFKSRGGRIQSIQLRDDEFFEYK